MAQICQISGVIEYVIEDDKIKDFYGRTLYVVSNNVLYDFYGRTLLKKEKEYIKDFYGKILYESDNGRLIEIPSRKYLYNIYSDCIKDFYGRTLYQIKGYVPMDTVELFIVKVLENR